MRPRAPLPLAPGAEFDLIRRFVSRGTLPERDDVRVGPGDDCAVVAGEGIALSVDMSVEGVHFRRDWFSPAEIGWRAAAAGLSDLAAMAARPIGLLVSLGVPEDDAGDFAVRLMDGVRDAAARVGAAVIGGDLTRSPGPVVVDVAVVGESPSPVLRSGARIGDEVWVTGMLGAAAASIARLSRGGAPPASALERFTCPLPRIREAIWLHARGIPRAMIDLSDGLLGDAAHLGVAGGVAMVLERASIPVHPAAAEVAASRDGGLGLAVSGGEDYELCFVAAAGSVAPLAHDFEAEFGIGLSRVGSVQAGEGVWWALPDGGRERADAGGFQHFGGGDG